MKTANPAQLARLVLIKKLAPRFNASVIAGQVPDQIPRDRDMPKAGEFSKLGAL